MGMFNLGRELMNVDLSEVWRDKSLASDIAREIKRQAAQGWKPWEILLPPDLLWPMLEEVSQGMVMQWSPMLFGTGVQVGAEGEVAIRFVLPDLKTSPVMVRSLPYHGGRKGDTVPVEVSNGNTVRV